MQLCQAVFSAVHDIQWAGRASVRPRSPSWSTSSLGRWLRKPLVRGSLLSASCTAKLDEKSMKCRAGRRHVPVPMYSYSRVQL